MTVEQILTWLERVASVGDDYVQMPSREALSLIAALREATRTENEACAALMEHLGDNELAAAIRARVTPEGEP